MNQRDIAWLLEKKAIRVYLVFFAGLALLGFIGETVGNPSGQFVFRLSFWAIMLIPGIRIVWAELETRKHGWLGLGLGTFLIMLIVFIASVSLPASIK